MNKSLVALTLSTLSLVGCADDAHDTGANAAEDAGTDAAPVSTADLNAAVELYNDAVHALCAKALSCYPLDPAEQEEQQYSPAGKNGYCEVPYFVTDGERDSTIIEEDDLNADRACDEDLITMHTKEYVAGLDCARERITSMQAEVNRCAMAIPAAKNLRDCWKPLGGTPALAGCDE